MTKQEFVARMLRACEVAKQKGAIINTQAVLAQGALESGWGNSGLARKWNNLFGIKAGTTWTGRTVSLPTFEFRNGRYVREVASWRVYDSWNLCLVDYSVLIQSRSWFKDALPYADRPDGDGDAYGWIFHLVDHDVRGELRWATSPDYVVKVIERVGAEVDDILGG